jgi:hypothetical protein
MKKFTILFAGAAALALSACGDSDEGADETAVVETNPAPTVTETAVVETDATDQTAGDDSVSVGEDGVDVNVNDGDTEVKADIDDDPGVTVRD